MIEKKIKIINQLGIHARAAMKLSQTAARYQSQVSLKSQDQTIDAKDILALMVLGVNVNTEIELIVDGPDEAAALKALVELIETKFGEAK